MEKWAIHFGFLMILGHFSSACILRNGTNQPWLIRIAFQKTQPPVTVAHGSLISPDKVLTAGNIESEMVKAGVDFTKPLGDAVMMVAYNSKEGCNQTRFAVRVDFHWKYDIHKYDYCRLGEFALLTAGDSFITAGAPFLVPSASYSSMAGNIETLLDKFNADAGNDTSPPLVSVYLYADKAEGGQVIEDGKMPYVSWIKCTEMDSFKKIVGVRDPNATSYSFFCTEKMPGDSGAVKNSEGFGYNWYQGAPVFFNSMSSSAPSQNSTPDPTSVGHDMAIGQFLFWTGETGVPFVFATYTDYLVNFILDRVPPQSTANASTESPPTWPTARPTILTGGPKPITRKPTNTRPSLIVPASGAGKPHFQSPRWILMVIGLLSFVFSSLLLCPKIL